MKPELDDMTHDILGHYHCYEHTHADSANIIPRGRQDEEEEAGRKRLNKAPLLIHQESDQDPLVSLFSGK